MTNYASHGANTERPKRLPEIVADQLQEFVLTEGLQPGDRLPTEPALTARYDVSRQVVREATRILEQRGVVAIRAGRGMTVANISVDGVHDIYKLFLRFRPENFTELIEARSVLDPNIAALAAERRTENELAQMRETIEASRSLPKDAFAEHLALDLKFHKIVTNACRNMFLIALANPVNESLRDAYAEPIAYLSSLPQTQLEHEAILRSLEKQDPEGARQATLKHLRRVRSETEKLIPTDSGGADEG
ncbi:FadR/GntR family transcriptional regulator [Leucobacter komagatae]|uniref:FadR/GntR family transcriptional regulator n=1 Tax=Leucobacter komagatae TaxID=55969 RepID=UPI0018DCBE6B|nr:FadR/GntR family transcriptional regulator [Leucobacter komagatae]